ncbi:MAG: hypothetical protein ACI8TP_000480 [Acidimicrobiales bacterium]|jgi:hypothetical protein
MTETEQETSSALRAAKALRVELKSAVSQVEVAAAGPIKEPGWQAELLQALEGLRIALDQHVEEVEADHGLLVEVENASPRLARTVVQVRDEHPVLQRQVAATIAVAKEQGNSDHVRTHVLETLMAVARHRQAGADLVYESYSVDLGGG